MNRLFDRFFHHTSRAAPLGALLLGLVATAQAGTFTVYTGRHCQSDAAVSRPENGALHNEVLGHSTTTRLFRCPVHRTQPLAYTGTLSVTLNVRRNASWAEWTCTLRAVDVQGTVFHSVVFKVPKWETGQPKTHQATSSSLNLNGLLSAAPHSVVLDCLVPDKVSSESAGLISYWVTELD